MNKTLRTMLLGVMAACGSAAWAQTDVTSTYLQNADFSKGTPITVGVCTYAKDKESNGTEFANLVPVEDWEFGVENGDGKAGGLVAFGSGVWVGGKGYTAPATNSDGESTGNILGLVGVWTGTAQYVQSATLPAGTYTLVLGVYNSVGGTTAFTKNLIGFIEDGGTEHLSTATTYPVNQWKYEFISFTLTEATAGKFSLGYASANNGSGAMPHLFLSGIQLFDGEVDAAAYEAAKEAVRTAKEAAILLADETYAAVTGEERTALQAAIDNNSDTETLKAAMKAFKDAKADYEAFIAAQQTVSTLPDLPYALASKKPAVANIAVTNAADAKAKAAEIISSVRAYYESNAKAEGIAGAVDMTASIANADATDGNNGWTWTGNMNDPRNTESWTDSNGKNDYMYFDGGNWNGTGWTTTMSQKITLPAGKYILTAKGRASEGVTLTMAVGEAQVELPHVGAAGNVFDRGWNDGTVEFTDAEGNGVEILITATTAGNHEWFSVGDFRLMQLEKITVEMAGDAEKTALAQAINEKVIGKQLGFDKDEYAPYNNIEALEAAKAVADILEKMDAGTEVTKKAADEALEALNAAVWTQNTADVDIVFNGMFATVTPGENYPLGWTRTNAWGQMQENVEGDFATAYYNQPGSMQYGNQGAYIMPLKADQWYKLTFYYRSHEDNSNNGITASVLNSEGEGLAETQFEGNGSKTEWAKGEVCFKPATAADYVLTLANNGNTWMTNVTIEKTTEDDPVGIATVAATAPAEQAIYNLAGQRVAKAQKGLYIINGNKVVVK